MQLKEEEKREDTGKILYTTDQTLRVTAALLSACFKQLAIWSVARLSQIHFVWGKDPPTSRLWTLQTSETSSLLSLGLHGLHTPKPSQSEGGEEWGEEEGGILTY